MKKILADFKKDEIKLLQGNFQKIADKNKVSRAYVSQIANNRRSVSSIKASNILKNLKEILTVLNGTSNTDINV
ncbi:hypothetical protein EZY14_016440 [Kordia sp. TARA_039_SRF]|nr:hypothetical protein EZY14_016440 [Kordia sp. TARA_039_SRF]